jgi:hypothetical protein
MNNFYLYRREGRDGGELIPWDKDNTMRSLDMAPWHNVERHALMSKVWTNPELRQGYLDTLASVASLASWLPQEMERQYAQIREAARADSLKPVSNDEFEAEIAALRRFSRERGALVRTYLARESAALPARAAPTRRWPSR